MPEIRISQDVYDRANDLALDQGFASLDDFVAYLLETALAEAEAGEAGEMDEDVAERLKGLGYLG